jgi:hypothetical protein
VNGSYWDALPLKMTGLRQLMACDLPVPTTVLLAAGDDIEALADILAATAGVSDAKWVVRFDAPPPLRFRLRGGVAHTVDVPSLIRAHWRGGPTSDYHVIVQRLVDRACDGIALRTAAGHVVIEVQNDHPGNFFRDGSSPRRWILTDGLPANVDALPSSALGQLLEALATLPVASCVEWVRTPEDLVYFVDLKPLPSDYLAAIDPSEGVRCFPVRCGEAVGSVDIDGSLESPSRIHVSRRTHVDLLARLGPWSRAVVFTGGGLLAHATAYAAQCELPVLLCDDGHLPTLSAGVAGRLEIGGSAHRFDESP